MQFHGWADAEPRRADADARPGRGSRHPGARGARAACGAGWSSTMSPPIITRASRSPAWAAGARPASTSTPTGRCCPATPPRPSPACASRPCATAPLAAIWADGPAFRRLPRHRLDAGALPQLRPARPSISAAAAARRWRWRATPRATDPVCTPLAAARPSRGDGRGLRRGRRRRAGLAALPGGTRARGLTRTEPAPPADALHRRRQRQKRRNDQPASRRSGDPRPACRNRRRLQPSARSHRHRQPGSPGRDGRASHRPSAVHPDDPRGVRSDRGLLRRRPGARARPRLGRRDRAAQPHARPSRARRAPSARPAHRVRRGRPDDLHKRRRLHRGDQPGARQASSGPAPDPLLRPRLQQHHQRRDPAADAVRARYRLPGCPGAVHLGLRRQGAALRL